MKLSSSYLSFSMSFFTLLKNGWSRASFAVILFSGMYLNNFNNKSMKLSMSSTIRKYYFRFTLGNGPILFIKLLSNGILDSISFFSWALKEPKNLKILNSWFPYVFPSKSGSSKKSSAKIQPTAQMSMEN